MRADRASRSTRQPASGLLQDSHRKPLRDQHSEPITSPDRCCFKIRASDASRCAPALQDPCTTLTSGLASKSVLPCFLMRASLLTDPCTIPTVRLLPDQCKSCFKIRAAVITGPPKRNSPGELPYPDSDNRTFLLDPLFEPKAKNTQNSLK